VKLYDGQSKLEQILFIQIDKIESSWVSDLFFGAENRLESGSISLGETTFQYCTLYWVPAASGYVTRFLHEKGYYVPAGLYKTAAKLYGNKGDTKLSINYLEDMEGTGYSKLSWKNKGDLNVKQREYLDTFNDRFMAALKFGKSINVPGSMLPPENLEQKKSISVRLEELRRVSETMTQTADQLHYTAKG
jgi:hypothetical protein